MNQNPSEEKFPAGKSSADDSSLRGAAICFLYGFPYRLKDERGAPKSSTVFVPLTEADSSLAEDFDSLAKVSFSNQGIRRFIVSKDSGLKVQFGQRDMEGHPPKPLIAAVTSDVFVTIYEEPGVVFLTINLHSEAFDTDDLIALTQSSDGENEPDVAAESQVGFGPINVMLGNFPHGLGANNRGIAMPSIRSAAYEYIRRANQELFDDDDLQRPDNIVAEYDEWRKKFGSPLRCIELKTGFRVGEDAPGNYQENASRFIQDNCRLMYGLVSGDEGWRFFPEQLARQRVRRRWGSRDFFSTVVFGQAILMVNFRSDAYVRFQANRGRAYWGRHHHGIYFSLNSRIAGLEHGPLRALENCIVGRTLQRESDEIIQETLHAIRLYYDTGELDVAELKKRRNDVVEKRISLYRKVRELIEVPIREFSDIGQMIRQETGIEAAMQDIRQRLIEVDAELTHIQQESDNAMNERRERKVKRLSGWAIFLTVFGLALTVLGVVLAYYALEPNQIQKLPQWMENLIQSLFHRGK